MKAFISWSGGKETSLSCYRVMRDKDIEVSYLLNMVSEDGKHSRSHGIGSYLLKLQAEVIGIPIVQKATSWQNYENEFKKIVLNLKREGIKIGVFGDIDLQEHRDWVERVCRDIGIKPILPLWKERREELLKEFIKVGFKALVIATKSNLLNKEWLGREINEEFIKELKCLGNIDLCGEKGEYHTFVYDGPIFQKSVEFITGRKILKKKHWFLEVIAKNGEG